MANTQSAEKRMRQTVVRNASNRARKSEVKTFLKKLNESIDSGNKEAALKQKDAVQKVIDQAVSVGVYKKNTASRMKSKFMRRIASMK
jgi:small subunit ribosomal protein S20